MLALTRRVMESIWIPTSEGLVQITLVKVASQRGKIGITAPRNLTVLRPETLSPEERERIKQQCESRIGS